MTLKQVKELLETTGVPVVYDSFEKGHAPALPYICYLTPGTNNFAADGKVYFQVKELQVELYTKIKDEITEGKVEEALSSFFWNKAETYIESERCYHIMYEMEV